MSGIAPNATAIATDALKIAKDAVLVSAGDPAAATAALQDVADLLEQLLPLLPPVFAPDLNPEDRAAADAAAKAELDEAFPRP